MVIGEKVPPLIPGAAAGTRSGGRCRRRAPSSCGRHSGLAAYSAWAAQLGRRIIPLILRARELNEEAAGHLERAAGGPAV